LKIPSQNTIPTYQNNVISNLINLNNYYTFCGQNASIYYICFFKFLFFLKFSFTFSPFNFIFSFSYNLFSFIICHTWFFLLFFNFLSSSFFHWACKFYAQHLSIAQTIQKYQPRCSRINVYTSNYNQCLVLCI